MGTIKNYKILVGQKAIDDISNYDQTYRLQGILSKFNELITKTQELLTNAQTNIRNRDLLNSRINDGIASLTEDKQDLITAYNDHKAIYSALVAISNHNELTEEDKTRVRELLGLDNQTTVNANLINQNIDAYEKYLTDLIELTNDLGIDIEYQAIALKNNIEIINSLLSDEDLQGGINNRQIDIEAFYSELVNHTVEYSNVLNRYKNGASELTGDEIESTYTEMLNNDTETYNTLKANTIGTTSVDNIIPDNLIINNANNRLTNIMNQEYQVPAEPEVIIPEPTYLFYIGSNEPTLANDDWKTSPLDGGINYQEIGLYDYPSSTTITTPDNTTPAYIYVLVANSKEVTFVDPTVMGDIGYVEGPIALGDGVNSYYKCFDVTMDANYNSIPTGWNNGSQIIINIS